MTKRWMVVLLMALGACSSGGSGNVTGTIGGAALGVKTALSSNSPSGSLVVLGSWTNGCGLGPNVNPKNSQALAFEFGQVVAATGTFTVAANAGAGQVAAIYVGNDDNCVVTSAGIGASGSVVVTAASADGLSGTFDVTMTNGDHITGSFDAPHCAADDVTASDGSPPKSTCQ